MNKHAKTNVVRKAVVKAQAGNRTKQWRTNSLNTPNNRSSNLVQHAAHVFTRYGRLDKVSISPTGKVDHRSLKHGFLKGKEIKVVCLSTLLKKRMGKVPPGYGGIWIQEGMTIDEALSVATR